MTYWEDIRPHSFCFCFWLFSEVDYLHLKTAIMRYENIEQTYGWKDGPSKVKQPSSFIDLKYNSCIRHTLLQEEKLLSLSKAAHVASISCTMEGDIFWQELTGTIPPAQGSFHCDTKLVTSCFKMCKPYHYLRACP